MGIPNLNKLIIEKSNNAVCKQHLSYFSGKKIVIDTSIYLYKYYGQNKLIENFYLLISLLLHYDIEPIFVFDGKPPDEKKELLKKRKLSKQDAEEKYKKLELEYNTTKASSQEKKELQIELDKLKKQFIRIKDNEIQLVKKLIESFGITYYKAEGEADVLCAQLVISNEAYGCLSDDMDLLALGCNKVLRYFSILNHTVILYDTNKILENLELTIENFRNIITLSCNDFNIKNNISIWQSFSLYKKYVKQNTNKSFEEWLIDNNTILSSDEFNTITQLFDSTKVIIPEKCTNNKNMNDLKTMLIEDGFIFID